MLRREGKECVTRGAAPFGSCKVLSQPGWCPKAHLYCEEPVQEACSSFPDCGKNEHWTCPGNFCSQSKARWSTGANKEMHKPQVMQVTGPEQTTEDLQPGLPLPEGKRFCNKKQKLVQAIDHLPMSSAIALKGQVWLVELVCKNFGQSWNKPQARALVCALQGRKQSVK